MSTSRPIAQAAEQRLADLGLSLPLVPKTSGRHVAARRAGQFLYLSGQGPRNEDGSFKVGKLGLDYELEEAIADARSVGLLLLAAARDALGSLDQLAGVVKLLGMVNCVPEFKDHSKVISGCSDLLMDVLGARGEHARSAVGMSSLPFGMPLEIEAIMLIADGG
jgi:enamine deaminase RidA (YjgF/YER057c/UK114 family)